MPPTRLPRKPHDKSESQAASLPPARPTNAPEVPIQATEYTLDSVLESTGASVTHEEPVKAPAPMPTLPLNHQAEALFEEGDFRAAYSLLSGIEGNAGNPQNGEHFKAACLFWMGRLAEAEALCSQLLDKSRASPLEGILQQIPELRRAQAGHLNEQEQLQLPMLHRNDLRGSEDSAVLRGKYRCYHCHSTFNVHTADSVISPLPVLRPILCPYCFKTNRIFCRHFGCPECHGRISVNMRWEGLELECPWCREVFPRPDLEHLDASHGTEHPFVFPGRSTDPNLSTRDQEMELVPMQFRRVADVESQLVQGRLPPWSACYRGPLEIERPFSEIAAEYFILRRHFDPTGARIRLAEKLDWITAPFLGLGILLFRFVILGSSSLLSPPAALLSSALLATGGLLLLSTPMRLVGQELARVCVNLSVLAALVLTRGHIAPTALDQPHTLRTTLVRMVLFPFAVAGGILTALGWFGYGLRLFFAGVAYLTSAWSLGVLFGMFDLRRKRTVLWDPDPEERFPFTRHPFSLEGIPLLDHPVFHAFTAYMK